ncbi:MAG TPA: DUF2939 domain-containing protein [Gemmatimonadales bacterium]|nr:DUF2939 domain-containing protein [Gemmatimonadales bacterium]
MKRVLLLCVVVLVAVVTWAYVSPRLAAKHFRDSAVAGDVAGLNVIVDFPSVRRYLEADLRATESQRVSRAERNPLAAQLGARLGGAISDALIERLVSAKGIVQLARYGSTDSTASPAELIGMGYQDLSNFGVTMGNPHRANNTVTFVFHRSGITWRLARLEIPSLMQRVTTP